MENAAEDRRWLKPTLPLGGESALSTDASERLDEVMEGFGSENIVVPEAELRRRERAMRALDRAQTESVLHGTDTLCQDVIESEIGTVRANRRKK